MCMGDETDLLDIQLQQIRSFLPSKTHNVIQIFREAGEKCLKVEDKNLMTFDPFIGIASEAWRMSLHGTGNTWNVGLFYDSVCLSATLCLISAFVNLISSLTFDRAFAVT